MWRVTIDLSWFASPGDTEPPDQSFFLKAYAELCVLDGLLDPDFVATVADRSCSYMAIINEADRETAVRKMAADVRSALHAAGGHTPEWERLVEECLAASRQASEPVDALV